MNKVERMANIKQKFILLLSISHLLFFNSYAQIAGNGTLGANGDLSKLFHGGSAELNYGGNCIFQ